MAMFAAKIRQFLRSGGNIQKIAVITFFSSLYFYSHIGTLYLMERGLNLFQANSITSIMIGAIFLAEVPTGIIADKIGRKRSIIIALVLQVLGEILYLFSRTYATFAIIAIIAGVGFAFASGCIEALIYDTLPKANREKEMQKAMGVKGAAYQLAFLLAPIAGGFLVPKFTLNRFLAAVAFTAASVFLALLVSLTVKEPEKDYKHQEKSPLHILREGISHIKGNRRLRKLMLVAVFTSGFSGILAGLYQPFFAKLNINTLAMGIAFGIAAFLAIISEKYAYKLEDFFGKSKGFLIATIMPGIYYIILSFSKVPLMAIFAFVLTYAAVQLKNPLLSSYQNELIPSKSRATILSLINLLVSAYIALIALFFGWLADINVGLSFLSMGIIITFSALILKPGKAVQAKG